MAAEGRLSELTRSVLDRSMSHVPADRMLVVALSGGADSAVCAWLALQVTESVRALHVHHGLEGSDLMAAAARAVAAQLGLELTEMRVQVPGGASPEGMARIVRHRALESAIDADEWLLSGHTADDQAETVLAHLLRGAGSAGLSGIAMRRDPWVRPLLGIPRSEIRALADELALPFADDPVNKSPEPQRNRIRNTLIPYLEREFNPALRRVLVRSAALLSADDGQLERLADTVPVRVVEGAVLVPASLLVTLPAPIATRAVRRALRLARRPYPGEAGEVEAVLAVAAGHLPSATLAGPLEVVREGPFVVMGAKAAPISPPEPLPAGGVVSFGHWTIRVALGERPPRPLPLGRRTAVLDAQAATDLEVRAGEEGERVDIGGGSKKLRDVLAEGGVPARLRAGWPVVAGHGRIAWVVAGRVANWAAAGPATKRFLVLEAR